MSFDLNVFSQLSQRKVKKSLTFSCFNFKNGQTYFKNLAMFTPQDF